MENSIKPGIYIVINPAKNKNETIRVLRSIKEENLAGIQIWDNPTLKRIDPTLIEEIISLFKGRTAVLINNKWELLAEHNFDGVHFDKVPTNLQEIEQQIGRKFIKGLTLENDLEVVQTAKKLHFDYLSFCAMFPSSTVSSCEIVSQDAVKKCLELTSMPIFLSGGITPHNLDRLNTLAYSGIAIVSGIMEASDPLKAIKEYNKLIRNDDEIRNNLK